jgi:hypothetical protein
VWGEGEHRAEVAAVERKHGVSPVLGGQCDVDGVSQVQVEARVLVLYSARCV